jgi:hypothetical protein
MGVISMTTTPYIEGNLIGKGDGTTYIYCPLEAQQTMFDIEAGDVLWFPENYMDQNSFMLNCVPVLSQLYGFKNFDNGVNKWKDFYSKICFQGIAERSWIFSDKNKYDKTGLSSQLAGTCSLLNITGIPLHPGQYLQWGMFEDERDYPNDRKAWDDLFSELRKRKGFPKNRFPLGFSVSPISDLSKMFNTTGNQNKNDYTKWESRALIKSRLMAKVLSYSDPGEFVDVLLIGH